MSAARPAPKAGLHLFAMTNRRRWAVAWLLEHFVETGRERLEVARREKFGTWRARRFRQVLHAVVGDEGDAPIERRDIHARRVEQIRVEDDAISGLTLGRVQAIPLDELAQDRTIDRIAQLRRRIAQPFALFVVIVDRVLDAVLEAVSMGAGDESAAR